MHPDSMNGGWGSGCLRTQGEMCSEAPGMAPACPFADMGTKLTLASREHKLADGGTCQGRGQLEPRVPLPARTEVVGNGCHVQKAAPLGASHPWGCSIEGEGVSAPFMGSWPCREAH